VNAAAAAHARRVEALASELARAGGTVGLAKGTSNLFRDRASGERRRLDVRALTNVLTVDAAAGLVDSEGMVTYEALTDACLAHGVMPAVVPQLKTITLGGAVAGVGIESSSHRHGLVHEAVEELEVLTAYRQCKVDFFTYVDDFTARMGEDEVDREALRKALAGFLKANKLNADWDGIEKAPNEALVNALAMMSPYGPAEKQAMLEAPDLKTRAEILIAVTEMDLAKKRTSGDTGLQ